MYSQYIPGHQSDNDQIIYASISMLRLKNKGKEVKKLSIPKSEKMTKRL
jgi:hypothetical protein